MDKVLVVVGYTDLKYYSRPLFPKAYDDINYKNKELLFVTEKNFPQILSFNSGDQTAAEIRAFGIEQAIKRNFDWVFFLDVDAIPNSDILDKLLEADKPLIGGTHPPRGDSTKIIGHYYDNYEDMNRFPILAVGKTGILEVNGVSASMMLVHSSIFKKCDYKGYRGIYHYPNRTTCDDEFYCLQIYHKLKIKPFIHFQARGWHLHSDGYAYRYYGEKRTFKRLRDKINFRGKIYETKTI